MNKVRFQVIVILCLVLSACTASKTKYYLTSQLDRYEYVSVVNDDTYHIPAELREYEAQLFDAVESSRLQLVSDNGIHELNPQQQSGLLLVRYNVNQTDDQTVVTANFIDYTTGRLIASCRGAYGSGLDRAGDLKEAIKRVQRQISVTFPRK